MPAKSMRELIEEKANGTIGVQMALMAMHNRFGDARMQQFLDTVPETGSALWDRFKAFKQAGKDRGAQIELGFEHFFASTIMPNPFR